MTTAARRPAASPARRVPAWLCRRLWRRRCCRHVGQRSDAAQAVRRLHRGRRTAAGPHPPGATLSAGVRRLRRSSSARARAVSPCGDRSCLWPPLVNLSTSESSPKLRFRHAPLPKLRYRRAQDHRDLPGAAADREDPHPPKARSPTAAQGSVARGGALRGPSRARRRRHIATGYSIKPQPGRHCAPCQRGAAEVKVNPEAESDPCEQPRPFSADWARRDGTSPKSKHFRPLPRPVLGRTEGDCIPMLRCPPRRSCPCPRS